ncbi:polysaccharide deacetylase family protein [Halorientalis halophila]|uniref:polysaccharide deacetylase family protein n=1 Tax=Halorientalis halophila TaxID=3108499 RepID=UPI0030093889
MYHYVRPPSSDGNYYYLDLSDFRRQLDYFESNYGFLDRESFVEAIRTGTDPGNDIVLTFDDGLRDHFDWVYPELRKRGLWGIFYVPTGPYETGSVLDVHRIHGLLGQFLGSEVLDELKDIVTSDMIPDQRRQDFRTYTYESQDNTEATTKVKRILNYYISYEHRSSVLNTLENRLSGSTRDVPDVYASLSQFEEMQNNGMIIGSHSVTHRVFSKLDRTEQKREIFDSFSLLGSAFGRLDLRTFCYPYGGDHTYDDTTLSLLSDADCEFAFSVESRDVTDDDLTNFRNELPRYDCNEFPHGEASGGVV